MKELKLKLKNAEFSISFENIDEVIEFVKAITEAEDKRDFRSITGGINDDN